MSKVIGKIMSALIDILILILLLIIIFQIIIFQIIRIVQMGVVVSLRFRSCMRCFLPVLRARVAGANVPLM